MKIFFLHNPKAGGTAINKFLSSLYSDIEISPLIENDAVSHEDLNGNYDNYFGYNFYSGHYGVDVFNYLFDGHQAVTNFRNPINRLVSLYEYFRYVVDEEVVEKNLHKMYAVKAAKVMEIDEFMLSSDERIRIYTHNYHSRQLFSSGWKVESRIDMDIVLYFVESMPWFYVCEEPKISMELASYWLGFDIETLPTLNETFRPSGVERSVMQGELLKSIMANNAHDFRLYRHGLSVLEKRVNCRKFV